MKVTIFFCITLVLAQSCYYDIENDINPAAETCDTLLITYSNDIQPIINLNCNNCHSKLQQLGGVDLETFSELENSINSGFFICTIQHDINCVPMPRNLPKLSDCEITKLEKWISNGAIEN